MFGHSPGSKAFENTAYIECIKYVSGTETANDVAARFVFGEQPLLSEHRQSLAHRCTRRAEHLGQRCLRQALTRSQLASQNHLADTYQGTCLLGIHAAPAKATRATPATDCSQRDPVCQYSRSERGARLRRCGADGQRSGF